MLKMVIRMDRNKIIIENKYKIEGIYSTIDNAFIQMGFPRQVSESDILVYCDNGSARDYGRFGRIVNTLKRQTWFIENVAEWNLYESDDLDNPNEFTVEDLLAHYRKQDRGIKRGTEVL